MNKVDFISGWNKLWALAPAGLGTALAIVGVAILVFAILSWLYKRRSGGGGGGMQGLPWMYILLAAVLAGPAIVIPALLGIASVLVNLIVVAVNFFVGLF